ncbi:organic cation transporter protein [Andrena cerasifolii]|uniref:organic cation transporter protein n=1 Tax=Andrena cerasifolii TaxID=2819439 RepID=UPI0040384F30
MSVAAQENWVCDNAYKATFAQSIFFVGSIFGGLFFGWMADKYGRVPVLIGTNMVGFVGGMSTIFASQFWQFLACRFVVGLAYDNTYVMAYILVLEYIGPQWRTFAAHMSYGLFYTLGALSLPWMAYGIGDWKKFTLATSLPLAIAILAPFFIPESVRWLVSKGELERAVKIISSIEKINKKEVPQDIYEDFLDNSLQTAGTLSAERHSFVDLFRTRRLRNLTILLMVAWGVIRMSYDGHIRCLDTFGMDIFTTFTIASATELPADMFVNYTLDTWGRRWTLFGSVFLSGLFSLGAASAPVGFRYASFAIVGRLFINIASNIAIQYVAELLPTVVRGEGLAFVHIIGYVTSIFSPFIAFSNRIMYNLPMIILGVACVGGGILCLFLPETLMQHLPQTMLEGELFGVEQSFWDNPFMKKRKPLESRGHHLHAKRPASRPGMLRSSMISGILSNARRRSTIQERVSMMMQNGASSSAPRNTTPLEYLQRARQEHSGDGNVAT